MRSLALRWYHYGTMRKALKDHAKIVAFVVRLPAEMHRRVTRLAANDDRSLNGTIVVALKRLLKERKET